MKFTHLRDKKTEIEFLYKTEQLVKARTGSWTSSPESQTQGLSTHKASCRMTW